TLRMSISTAGNVSVAAPSSGTALTVVGGTGLSAVTFQTPSDSQVNIDAASGGRYSTLSFSNAGTLKAQTFWDNTLNAFFIGVGSRRLEFNATGTPYQFLNAAGATLDFTSTGAGSSAQTFITFSDSGGVRKGYVGLVGSNNMAISSDSGDLRL